MRFFLISGWPEALCRLLQKMPPQSQIIASEFSLRWQTVTLAIPIVGGPKIDADASNDLMVYVCHQIPRGAPPEAAAARSDNKYLTSDSPGAPPEASAARSDGIYLPSDPLRAPPKKARRDLMVYF